MCFNDIYHQRPPLKYIKIKINIGRLTCPVCRSFSDPFALQTFASLIKYILSSEHYSLFSLMKGTFVRCRLTFCGRKKKIRFYDGRKTA